MTELKNSLLTTTAIDRLRASMTPAERAMGRFMRGPDHGAGDPPPADPPAADPPADPPADPAGDPPPADPPADPAPDGDKSLMNGKEGDPPADPDPATLPPEKYELEAPEGFAIDEDLLGKADPVFRDLGLTSEQANKLMPLVPAFAEKLFAQQNDAFQQQAAGWAKEAKADKELGGANWAQTETYVAKALDELKAPKEFRDLLDNTKLGNHPEMIRMFRKVGEMLSEASALPRGDAGAPVKLAREEVLYPHDVPKKETA